MSNFSEFQPSQRSQWAEGQPISELMSRALASPNLISLAAGFVDQASLPVEETQQAFAAMLKDEADARAALQYGTTPGFPRLREEILSRAINRDKLSNVDIDRVIVTAGSNQLLHLVGESLLDPGDIVLCSSPTYLVFLGTLSNIGAQSYGVAADENGMIPEALEETLNQLKSEGKLPQVKAIYLVPYFNNPSGVSMPAARRSQVVELARQFSTAGKIHVIEDAAYRELRYDGDDIPGFLTYDEPGETVIVAGTFSKSYSPGIRIGWGILPDHLVDPVCNQKGNIDFGSPNFSQHLMASVLQQGLFEPHVELLKNAYREKRDAMLLALKEFLSELPGVSWIEPEGGLYVWLKLPPKIDAGPQGELFDTAIAEGMFYVPGQYCYPAAGKPVERNTIRLSFGVQKPPEIREGVRLLGVALEKTLARAL